MLTINIKMNNEEENIILILTRYNYYLTSFEGVKPK